MNTATHHALITVGATENESVRLFFHEDANPSCRETIRLMSDGPTSGKVKTFQIAGEKLPVKFIGYPYESMSDALHVMNKLIKNMNMKEYEKDLDNDAEAVYKAA